jgi:hypothetical protein
MVRALLRSLALSCGLLLLLPPHWCCLLGGLTQLPPEALQGAKSKTACCPCCGGKHDTSSTPAPGQVPDRDGKCPCGERIATAPGVSVIAGPDLMLPAPGAVTGADQAAPACPAFEPPAAYTAPSHFRILNCVWLC